MNKTLADQIVSKACNEHRNSDLRADNREVIAAFNAKFTEFQHEIYRLGGQVRSQIDALNHWCRAFDATQLEARVRTWVESRIGVDHMNRRERAMRLFEESAELLQSEGVSLELALKQVQHVYDRPAGEPLQEAGGVAVCLYGYCAAAGVSLTEVAGKECDRIEAKPIDQIRVSLARKADDDLVTVVERKHQPFEYSPGSE